MEKNKKNKQEKIIFQGFDRGVEYKSMKEKLIKEYDIQKINLDALDNNSASYVSQKRILNYKLIYLLISMIQLRNGSRISEAVDAFRQFIDENDFKTKVIVKIAKSESIKYKKGTGEKFLTKIRYRKIKYPDTWVSYDDFSDYISDFDSRIKYLPNKRIQKRVLDYLLKYFYCNTHSLRYAFINYLLYDQKRPMTDVAKFVGHSNINQLVTYTQLKNTDQIFDLDI